MIAMHYGCVPVVHATGGLKDTVEDGQTGFLFEGTDVPSLCSALRRAIRVFSNTVKWLTYQKKAMQKDFSWNKSASQYAHIYRSLIPGSK